MHKLLLSLLAIPTVTSSVLITPLMVVTSAAEVPEATQASCTPVGTKANLATRSVNHKTLSEAIEIPVEYPGMDFSVAESDAAVTLFGCDCPSCIGALRQLRSQPLVSVSEGHCWSASQNRASQQEVQQVLQTLEAQETN